MNQPANRTTTQAVIGALKAAKIEYTQYSSRPRRLIASGVEVDQIGRLVAVQYHSTFTDAEMIRRDRAAALNRAADTLKAAGFVVEHLTGKGMVVVRGKAIA